jgi:hypothetical protein
LTPSAAGASNSGLTPAARLGRCLREILDGEASGPNCRPGLHASEDGMIALVTLFVILFFLILVGLIANAGHTVNRKIETQNAADASAISGTVWMARGMNAITATNHVMGEMMSLVVLHEAFGGKKLRGKTPEDADEAGTHQSAKSRGTEVRQAAEAARTAQVATGTIADQYIGDDAQNIEADATILHGKNDLLRWLRIVYTVKQVAGALEQSVFPPTVIAGYILDAIAFVVELYCLAEWIVLDIFQFVAQKVLLDIRNFMFEEMLPAAGKYEGLVAQTVPRLAVRAAEDIAKHNRAQGTLYPKPTQLRLPVIREAGQVADGPTFAQSQIVRATYPWVLYHRRPLIRFMFWMIFSQTPRWYHEYTHKFTRTMCREFYEENNPSPHEHCLYVMENHDPLHKGEEPWTTDSRLADQLFTVVGLAHRQPPTVISPGAFGQPNPQGLVAYAQAILYNANAQSSQDTGRKQRDVGWDTLNWRPPTASNNTWEYPPHYADDGGGQGRPEIKINWQAKLVPVTRLQEAANGVSAPYRPVLQRLPLDQERPFRNH